ncbi:MAG: SDR family NAD(P)-dependent oxidoreductase, partial [Hyphomicrobiaceae bacterium]
AIVGAGEGLGSALAAKFAREAYDIALVSRSDAGSAAAFNAACQARAAANVQFFRADANYPETIEQALADIARDMGDVDILIYNVRGEFTRCEPLDMTYEALENVYRLEVIGAFAAAKSVLPAMRKRGRGSVFFSSATAAFRGSNTHPLYAIGKFGLRALSQSLCKAYSRDGVHFVHVRLDCDLDTPIMRELYGDKFDQERMANTADVAESYWHAHRQPRSAWSNEIELRPYTETWTC